MSVISKKQYSEAYAIGCRVYNNEITLNEGKSILIDIHKLNSASATDYIYAVKHMLNGDVYKRALSAGGVEYYLEKINDDFGMAALNKAIISVNKHIEYYEGIGKKTKLNKLRIIIDKLNNNTIPTLIDSFYEQVKKSIQEPSLIRKERLLSANKYPEKKPYELKYTSEIQMLLLKRLYVQTVNVNIVIQTHHF